MSGGSYDYIYSKLIDECSGQMFDDEMEEMLKDFAKVLHDLEWWCSSDISEEDYRQTVKEFKNKWFKGNNKRKTLNEQRLAEGLEPVEHKMSREEAIKTFNTVLFFGKCDASKEEIEECLKMAIKALEEQQNPNSIRINFVGEEEAKEFNEYLKNQQPKESVLDKIRDEAKELDGKYLIGDYGIYGENIPKYVRLWDVLQIIDKYKESEVKE